jgi:integrase
MATLITKKDSKFWHMKFKDAEGVWRLRSTGLLRTDPRQTAEARIMQAKLDAAQVDQALDKQIADRGWGFVEEYLETFAPKPKTQKSYRGRWNWISLFLAEKKFRSPQLIEYKHANEYIKWRTGWKKRTGKTVCRNTAIGEVKFFSQVMEEAARRNLCTSNPLVKLRLIKDDPEEKPEITDAEFQIILPALETLPPDKQWMKYSFLIAMHTGCRLGDTRMEKMLWDFERDTITFLEPKGGKKRDFSVPMPAPLRPLLLEVKKKKLQPQLKFPFQPSRKWQHFFQTLGLDHLCFHCLRVTFITRLARHGVPIARAMRLVNHASTTIHRIYQRLNVDDVREIPDLFDGTAPTQPKQRRRKKTL